MREKEEMMEGEGESRVEWMVGPRKKKKATGNRNKEAGEWDQANDSRKQQKKKSQS